MGHMRRVVPFTALGRGDIGSAGGKNASLGELTGRLTDAGWRGPPDFATIKLPGRRRARHLGTGNATEALRDGADVTVSCTEGSRGKVYAAASRTRRARRTCALPATRTRVMLNLAGPSAAFRRWRPPAGVHRRAPGP
ncbi:hypothetical protein [Streptomyces sp. R33]|uniref:Uncharacterized protein n=1 Tax=Streptomyces sp. R33 TaxID=3238629 RepID=A0AB39YDL7_9ACTN